MNLPRLSLALLAVLATPLPALAQAQEAATVVHVRDALRGAIAPSSAWSDVAAQSYVKAGDTLKTGAEAAAELSMPDGALLRMGENTLVRWQAGAGLTPRVLVGQARLLAPAGKPSSIVAGEFTLTGADGEAIVSRQGGKWSLAVLSGAFKLSGGAIQPMTLEAGKLLTVGGGSSMIGALNRTRVEELQRGLFLENAMPAAAAAAGLGGTTGANKWVATGLSAMLPGTGQLYAGDLTRGLTYMGLNFALLGTTLYARSNGQATIGTAAMIGLVGLNVLSPLDAMLFTPEKK